jgi:hypothetical protein
LHCAKSFGLNISEIKYLPCRIFSNNQFLMPFFNVNRLGFNRKNYRDYCLHLRRFGKTAGDRMLERKYTKMSKLFSSLAVDLIDQSMERELTVDEQDDLDIFLLEYSSMRKKIVKIQTPCLEMPDPIDRTQIGLHSFTDQQIESKTGWSKVDIRNLLHCMRVPDHFTLNSG